MAKSAEYAAWKNMRARCSNPNHPKFPQYGARGITYDPAWESFNVFLQDVGPRPSPLHSLDRINNDKGYSKANCRWASWVDQNNNRRVNVVLSAYGKKLTLAQWALETGIPRTTITYRLSKGYSPEEAVSRRTFYAGPKPHRPV